MAQIAGSLESLQSAVRESKQVLVQTAADLVEKEIAQWKREDAQA